MTESLDVLNMSEPNIFSRKCVLSGKHNCYYGSKGLLVVTTVAVIGQGVMG